MQENLLPLPNLLSAMMEVRTTVAKVLGNGVNELDNSINIYINSDTLRIDSFFLFFSLSFFKVAS